VGASSDSKCHPRSKLAAPRNSEKLGVEDFEVAEESSATIAAASAFYRVSARHGADQVSEMSVDAVIAEPNPSNPFLFAPAGLRLPLLGSRRRSRMARAAAIVRTFTIARSRIIVVARGGLPCESGSRTALRPMQHARVNRS